jgi:mRNA-degrading endonuclease RelE of RelBE toxin-antitoxin system
MAHWKINVVNEALKEFYDLPLPVRTRIRETLRVETCKKYPCGKALVGCPGWYSIRIGKYRLVYAPYHDEVHVMLVTSVGLHDEVYNEIHRRYAKYGR